MALNTKTLYALIGIGVLLIGVGVFFALKKGNTTDVAPVTQTQATTTPETSMTSSASTTPSVSSTQGEAQKPTPAGDVTSSLPSVPDPNGNGVPTKEVNGAIITTNMGVIEVAFDGKGAPNTVTNFVSLILQHFYDGIKFHRVIKGFMIQVGDPLTKDDSQKARWGTGGPGYAFKDELTGNEKYTQGTLAMANSGPNTNGSQFFIVTASPSVSLPPLYTVFGHVTKGMDVALKIENVKTETPDRPVDPVIIQKIELK